MDPGAFTVGHLIYQVLLWTQEFNETKFAEGEVQCGN